LIGDHNTEAACELVKEDWSVWIAQTRSAALVHPEPVADIFEIGTVHEEHAAGADGAFDVSLIFLSGPKDTGLHQLALRRSKGFFWNLGARMRVVEPRITPTRISPNQRWFEATPVLKKEQLDWAMETIVHVIEKTSWFSLIIGPSNFT
jgi:hypothetical protein